MDGHEIELTVGDVLDIDGYTVTVIEIDGADVSFRIDSVNIEDSLLDELHSLSIPQK